MQVTRIRYTRKVNETDNTYALVSKPMQGKNDLFIGVIHSDLSVSLHGVGLDGNASKELSRSQARTMVEAKKLMKATLSDVGVTFTDEVRNRGGLLLEVSDTTTQENIKKAV